MNSKKAVPLNAIISGLIRALKYGFWGTQTFSPWKYYYIQGRIFFSSFKLFMYHGHL